MSTTTTTTTVIHEEESPIKKAPTLVRRVSDMFKDGTYSGPPSLFSQKIRHCCQNLNLLPYLLYSFENSKSHPLAKKVNLCFDLILKNFVQRILFVYSNFRRTALRGIQQKSLITAAPGRKEDIEYKTSSVDDVKAKLCNFDKPKPKSIPFYFVMAVYLAPLFLVFQLIVLCCLLVIGKFTPGFVFLVMSLIFLGIISMKVMFHGNAPVVRTRQSRSRSKTRSKRKEE